MSCVGSEKGAYAKWWGIIREQACMGHSRHTVRQTDKNNYGGPGKHYPCSVEKVGVPWLMLQWAG